MSESEPTPGELARRLDRLDTNLTDGFRGLREQMDRMVSLDVFQVTQQATDARVAALAAKDASLEQKIERVEERRTTDRRMLWPIAGSAVIAAGGWVINALGGVPPTP